MTLISTLLILAQMIAARAYDPLARGSESIEHIDLVVHDDVRRRFLPLRIYMPPPPKDAPSAEPGAKPGAEPGAEPGAAPPAAPPAAPVILFSHGLGGSSHNNPYLGEHWAARGYVAVFMQHPGSDDRIWRDVPLPQRMNAIQKAATGANLLLRVRDVSVVIDQLERWNAQKGHALAGRLDLSHIGMSGHSFGAMTTQAVSGQTALMESYAADARIDAAVVMSPSAPVGKGVGAAAVRRTFSSVKLPWLLMTGTLDESPIGRQTPESRQLVFPALPPGGKYEIVLFDAEHSAFGDRSLPGEGEARNPNHHRVILALTSAFWDAYLRDDPQAKAWLESESTEWGPRAIIEPQDRWQRK